MTYNNVKKVVFLQQIDITVCPSFFVLLGSDF